jgi:hypothetical protein
MFEVQTLTLCQGWINCWTAYENGYTEKPLLFNTREEAQAALDEFLEDEHEEYLNGNMEDMYDEEDFRIMEVDPNPNQSKGENIYDHTVLQGRFF